MEMYKDKDIRTLIVLCRERDDAAFDELVRRYTPMMRKLVSGFESTSLEYDELFAEACVGLHLAAQRYNLEQSEVTFGLYSRICVRNRILDLIKHSDSDRGVESVDVETLSDGDSVSARLEEREMFESILTSARNLLSDYEYRVLMLHIQGYKTASIASALNKSSKSVDNAKARLFRRLRAEVGNISEK